jgi:hypothetical protein
MRHERRSSAVRTLPIAAVSYSPQRSGMATIVRLVAHQRDKAPRTGRALSRTARQRSNNAYEKETTS